MRLYDERLPEQCRTCPVVGWFSQAIELYERLDSEFVEEASQALDKNQLADKKSRAMRARLAARNAMVIFNDLHMLRQKEQTVIAKVGERCPGAELAERSFWQRIIDRMHDEDPLNAIRCQNPEFTELLADEDIASVLQRDFWQPVIDPPEPE